MTLITSKARASVRPRASALGGVAVVLLVVLAACSSVGSQCSTFCTRYRECIDGNVSVDACENACERWAEGSSANESKLASCDECLSQNDVCTETTRRCTADCLGIPVR